MSSLPQKQTRWLPTVHRGMWRMRVLESSCLPLLAWAFLALCCSCATWCKNMTVLLWERILRHQFTVFYSFYWLYCRQQVILCITRVTRLCFLWAVKVLFLKMDGCFLQSVFQTVVSLLIERRNVESCFLGNVVFIHCAPLKGASSPLGCLLKYFYRL